jgi:hypothetical protein
VRYSAWPTAIWRCASSRRWRRCRARQWSTPAMLRVDHGAAQPVADLRRHRLVPDPVKRTPKLPHARAAPRAGAPDPARAPEPAGHDHGLLDRAQRRLVVADGPPPTPTPTACCWPMVDDPAWKDDIGRLARGALGRQQKGRWDHDHRQRLGRAGDRRSRASSRRAGHGQAPADTLANGASLWTAPARGTVLQAWPRAGEPLEAAPPGQPASRGPPCRAWPPCPQGGRCRAATASPAPSRRSSRRPGAVVARRRLPRAPGHRAQADMSGWWWTIRFRPAPACSAPAWAAIRRSLSGGERAAAGCYPAFQERTFEAFRAYYEFVPKGRWSVEYTVRLNNEGRFSLPPRGLKPCTARRCSASCRMRR